MKRLFKLLVNTLAIALCVVGVFTFTGCKDIKTVEINFSVYNFTSEKFEDKTLTVDLYRHLAPKTVDNILTAINDGYYENTIVYKKADATSQVMFGDYKVNGQNIVKNADRPLVEGEFEANGLKGSKLVNEKGVIGLYRSYTADGESYTASDNGRNSGSAVCYMPLNSISSYNGYFTLFAKYDLDNAENSDTIQAITSAFSVTTFYEEYEVFYTVENGDKKLNIVSEADFSDYYNDQDETYNGFEVYKAKESDLVSMNRCKIYVPMLKGVNRAVVIKNVKVK